MSSFRTIATAVTATLVAVLLVPLTLGSGEEPAAALSGSEFDPGHIISDEEFFDHDSMTEAQIQSFLEAVTVSCSPGFYCADTIVMPRATTSRAPDRYCDGYTSRTNETVARIVHKVAQSCGINPQVLLVMLQKEQGLFRFATRSADAMTTTYTYRAAMGYGCPDTAACDALYLGFDNQVYSAARQLQVYTQNPGWWSYRIGSNSIGYHPDSIYRSPPRCGKQAVTIRNQATANLYIYTPYVPNAAALANLRGTGDSCSSYGNRNFWVFYNDWFGSPTGASPDGRINSTSVAPGVVSVVGWALDPDTSDPIDIRVHIDGSAKATFVADVDRADVGAAFPALGSRHGFELDLRMAPTSREFCLYAVNKGGGEDTLLGCRNVTPMSGNPVGTLEIVEQRTSGTVIAGWALDPDSAEPATVDILVDGVASATVTTSIDRPDVSAQFPAYSALRGFEVTIPDIPRGTRTVCVRITNVGFGAATELPCAVVRTLDAKPDGRLESVIGTAGGVLARGWAIDRDRTSAIRTHLYIDGRYAQESMASATRTDVGSAYPHYGDVHGVETFVPTAPGVRELCLYGINEGPGSNRLLACRSADVRSGPPIGRISSGIPVTDGVAAVTGWALDFDALPGIGVHVYRNGEMYAAIKADQPRADVKAAYPGYPDTRGFSTSVELTGSRTEICVYGINQGAGRNALLQCRVVTQ